MVKINKIYTKNGDNGTTQLVGGDVVSKVSLRVAAYGDIDELNATLGMIRTLAEQEKKITLSETLAKIQNDLFDIGSILATPHGKTFPGMAKISEAHVSELEMKIDEVAKNMPELRSFVLPGGTQMNGWLHIARTVCRRAERSVLMLHQKEPVEGTLLKYLNRLSDLFFALARKETHDSSVAEYLWVQQKI